MIPFPDIHPVAFSVFGWPIRWYGLGYFFGLLGAWRYCRSILSFFPQLSAKNLEDLLGWTVVGVIVGGRLGYVLLYDPLYYWAHPLRIFQVWQGGMAFHGGLLGVVVCLLLYCWKEHLPLRQVTDCVACGAPLALFVGRLGNFINQEVYGRPTDAPWAMIFPNVDAIPRHPSQLYEAFMEGIVPFLFLRIALIFFQAHKKPGLLTGLFLMSYAVGRIFCEFFRTPDGLWFWGNWTLTTGQAFSLPLLFIGPLVWMLKAKSSHDAP